MAHPEGPHNPSQGPHGPSEKPPTPINRWSGQKRRDNNFQSQKPISRERNPVLVREREKTLEKGI